TTYRVDAGVRWASVIKALDPIGFSPTVMQSNTRGSAIVRGADRLRTDVPGPGRKSLRAVRARHLQGRAACRLRPMGGDRGARVTAGVAGVSAHLWHTLPRRRHYGRVHGVGLSRSQHHHARRAGRLDDGQNPLEPAAWGARPVRRLVRLDRRTHRTAAKTDRHDMNVRFKRGLIIAAVLVAAVVIAAAAPIIWVEKGCGGSAVAEAAAAGIDIRDAGFRRAEGDSYLTYPEWYIVHAYTDLAGVTRRSSESHYDCAAAIGTFWSCMCQSFATARSIGPVTLDQGVTDYIIGLSFSLEMAVQGAYERTIGAWTAFSRGDKKTLEHEFNQRFLDDYAAFLQQTPWFKYPFKAELIRFWRETPWSWNAPVRGAER